MVFNRLKDWGDNLAIITPSNASITYTDLATRCDTFSAHLDSEKKSLIAILAKNTPESLVAYLAALRSNHAVMLLPDTIDDTFLKTILDRYTPQFIWTEREFSQPIVYTDNEYKLYKCETASIDIHEDLAVLLSTSGTVGSPKMVRLSYTNIEANAQSIAEYLDITSSERPITTLAPNYSYGLSIINSHLLSGATLLLTPNTIFEAPFWDFLKSQKATSISGVPYIYQMLKRLRFTNMDLPHLKTLTQAGGKLPQDLAIEFAQYAKKENKRFVIMYGQTEATARISYVPHDRVLDVPNSIGKAIPGGKLSIIDDNKAEISAPNVEGELIYTGPNVMMGYAEDSADLAKADTQNGQLETGDIAYKDEHGYFYIAGRKKRFIKIAGNRVNLDEVEMHLRNNSFDVAVSGSDDRLRIATTEDNKKDLLTFLAKTIKVHHTFISVEPVDELYRNNNGKLEYKKIFNRDEKS